MHQLELILLDRAIEVTYLYINAFEPWNCSSLFYFVFIRVWQDVRCTDSCTREHACKILLVATFGEQKLQNAFWCYFYISALFLHIGSPCINDINNNGVFKSY